MSPVPISIRRHEDGFQLQTEIRVAEQPEEVFAFFADAGNLQLLTPCYLHFKILTPLPVAMQTGTLIDYQLRLHGLPIRWQTEICTWEPPACFVDRQRKGPYRKWVHRHEFRRVGDTTVVTDRVDYSMACGRLANALFVARDLRGIFAYRAQRLAELFTVVG
jgi:ligand-binding SRPBCC domain-containing protein